MMHPDPDRASGHGTVGIDAPADLDRLPVLEAIISRAFSSYMEVGTALEDIRDGRLYRRSHPTFEVYVAERWEMSRSRAYQLIDAAGVARLVSTIVDTPRPASESVARELVPWARVDPDAACAAWSELVEATGGQPTAAAVREAVKDRPEAPRTPYRGPWDRALDEQEILELQRRRKASLATGESSIDDLAAEYGISRRTVYRYLGEPLPLGPWERAVRRAIDRWATAYSYDLRHQEVDALVYGIRHMVAGIPMDEPSEGDGLAPGSFITAATVADFRSVKSHRRARPSAPAPEPGPYPRITTAGARA